MKATARPARWRTISCQPNTEPTAARKYDISGGLQLATHMGVTLLNQFTPNPKKSNGCL